MQPVLAITPNTRNTVVFSSINSAARQLSGDGTTSRARTIRRRLAEGGGYVGGVYVERLATRPLGR
jgi:hypothetical protein